MQRERCSTCHTVGEHIRHLRTEQKIGLRELARMSSLTAPFLSDLERGLRRASNESLAALAPHLNVSPRALIRLSARERIATLTKRIEELAESAR